MTLHTTYWSDVSQWQGKPVDDTYPHEIFSFRTNTGNTRDTLGIENARRSLDMMKRGKLKAVIAYYFFRPGQANCDLHVAMLRESGLWGHPGLVTMVDVEGDAGKITGNHTAEINDEVSRLRSWYGSEKRVIGYLNPIADPNLWRPPSDMKIIVPSYSGRPGVWARPLPAWIEGQVLAHQFTDAAMTKPWTTGTDLNYTTASVEDVCKQIGVTSTMGIVEDGAAQIGRKYGNVRKPVGDALNYLPRSFRDKDGPAFNDMVAAIVNETVWNGYEPDKFVGDEDSNEPRALVGLVLLGLARQKRIEAKLDRVLDIIGGLQ